MTDLIICVHDNIIQCQKRLKEARRLKRNIDRRIQRAYNRRWILPSSCNCCGNTIGRRIRDEKADALLNKLHPEAERLWNLVLDLEDYIRAIKLVNKGIPK